MAPSLPSSAYSLFTSTTADVEDTPLCKLIISVSPDTSEYSEKGDYAREIATLVERGYATYDVPGTEASFELVDAFRSYVGRRFADAHTQLFVRIDLEPAARQYPSRRYVEGLVDAALSDMDVERISVSLAWPAAFEDEDYGRSLEVLEHMTELRREGKVSHFGVIDARPTFMRTAHDQGARVDYCVACFNVIDSRHNLELNEWCQSHGVLFIASSMGGGLLSERFLGVPEPMRLASDAQRRFVNTIAAFGGWSLFQELLFCLKALSEKYQVSIANVALRWVLQQRGVHAAILDGPLAVGPSSPFADNERVFAFSLDDDDFNTIEEVTSRGW